MPIPDYETLMLPLLRIAETKKGNEVALIEAIGQLASEYKLTEEEKRELLPSGSTFKFSSRVSWARTYLQKAGLLEPTRRGFFKITQRGMDVLKKKPQRIDNKLLFQFEEFKEFQGRKKAPKDNGLITSETPIESMAAHYEQLRAALVSELLERVKKCSPQFFERLVIRLLVQMGYGGSLKDAGQAIGRVGDGGVDGVIREDKLGLDNIYIQAKRWTDKPVGSPDIDQFAGALSKKKATKGIFITASTFTKDALASVREYSSRIILIDGVSLADFMIDHGVGVSVAQTYEIKKIDSDFFEEDLE
ncbi:MAG: restriction endonuclease [Nitrospirae bacterium]|nr:restriction endonuclease [Nitrospirota bacterium]